MNKKGYDYAALMVIVVIIAVGALYVQIAKKTQGMEREIGESQAAILKINSETTLYEVYVQEAAKLALKEANNCVASLADAKFIGEMDKQLKKYAGLKKYTIPSTFELAFTGKELVGVALEPTIIPVIDKKGKQLGTALYKPTFKIPAHSCSS